VDTGNGEYAAEEVFEFGLVEIEPGAASEMFESVWNLHINEG
jgi:hypothetical protein